MATLKEIDLGDIQSEDQTKDSNLLQFPLPASDSSDAILIDIMGCFRTISLSGIITGTVATQNTFIAAIEGLVDGNQGSGFTFVSSQAGTSDKTVLISSFNWNKQAGDVNKLDYSLTLFQGGI